MRLSLQRCCLLLTVLLGIPGLLNGRAHSVVRAGAASKLYLDASRPFATRYVGSDTLVEAMRGGQAKALSMTQADLNEDGVADLVAGYRSGNDGLVAVYRGSLDAMAPQSPESFQAIARGEFPSPFLPDARVFSVPAAPDFLGHGQFTPSHHIELILAARGGRAAYVLKRDDADNWSVAQAVEVPGEITALAAARILTGNEYAQVFIGVHGGSGPKLLVYSGSAAGLSLAKSWRLARDAADLAVGNLDGDALPDAAVLAGTHVLVLHGRDLREAAGAARDSAASLEAVSVPFKVSAIALGAFVYDRDQRLQMALLSPDGAVHIVAHGGFDGRPLSAEELRAMSKRRFARDAARRDGLRPASAPAGGRPEVWKEIERFSAIVAMQPGGRIPLLFRTRISGFAADDVMALDRGRGTLAVIEHPNGAGNAAGRPGVVVRRRESLDSVVAAMPMRVNVDGRPGVVLLSESQVAPFVMMPLPDPTFVVNTTADTVTANACALGTPNACSLREAIIEANAAAGTDTIMIPAGTYQLTIAPNLLVADPHDASGGDLDITDGVNIVGADPATTIIQAGLSAAAGIDKIFSINPRGAGAGFDVSISNVTLRFGKNPYAALSGDEFGGALDWSAGTDGTGNLTITNCVITNNATTDGDGGGIALSNPGGSGVVTITNSTIQNNSVLRATTGNSGVGGGILADSFTSVVITNSQVLNNQALQVIGVAGQGGGMFLGPFSHSFLHHCTISGNHAAGNGGGIWTNQGLTIDQATIISGNTVNNNGGGLWNDCGDDFTFIDSVTFAGNSAAAGGGGIHVDISAPQTLLIHFSRIVNNSALTGSGLDNIAGVVDATDNWWGCNRGPTLAPCDQIALSGAATGSNSFDPWIVLSHTANPPTIGVGGSTTLTASFLQDSQGGSISAGNLTAFTGVPIAFNNPVRGTLSNQQPSIQPSGTATATFTANAVGAGQAEAVVDSATVTANITILALAPPTISKSFGAATIAPGSSTSLSFTINNPNASGLTGVGFVDTLPSGLVVSTPNGLTGSCGGGTITAVAGLNGISLSGGTLAASSSCTFSVNVTGQGAGPQNNTTGPVNSTEGGAGAPSNTATVTVAAAGAVGIPTLGTVGVAVFLLFLAIGGMLMLGRARIGS